MRLSPILFILFILSGLWSGRIQAAAPVSVLVDPTTYVLVRPTATQLANANNLGGGGGGGSYIFTASDFNESGSTISLDFTNGQKATSLIPGFLSAADWVTFNAKAPTASPTFTGTPVAPTAAADTNTTQIATTGFVIGQGYLKSSTAASTYQGLDSDLTSIAALATTSFGRSLLTQSSAATVRAALDLEAGTDFLAYPTGTPNGSKFLRDDNTWVSIAGGGDALVANPLSQFAATTSAQLAGVLSDEEGSSGGFVRSGYLGSAALEATSAFQAADGDLTTYANITPSANVQSLLGAADYSAMRTQLSLVPGTNVQAYDADLTTYAGITPSANIQTFLGAANYAAMRTQLGLVISTDVQAYDSDLSLFGAITPSANVQSLLGAANYAAMRTLLDLEAGTDFLAYPTGTPTGSKFLRDDNTWQTVSGSGMGGNYTVTGNIVASSGNVTIQSASGQNIILTPGAGGAIVMGTVNATTLNAGNITGATGDLQLFVGNATTGNFTMGNLVEGTGIDITKGATDVTITSTAASNIIVGPTTVTTNSTGNLTLIAGDNITLTANNTNKSVTINATGGGSGAETGDVKFILDSASVPSGWALTGFNGIAAFTTPDADYKPVIKMAGTVATPTFSPAAGAVPSGHTITISSATSGATFMTTNNTTDPSRSVGTAGSTWVISANQTIESMAYKDGAYLIDSAIASAAYTIDPLPIITAKEINGTALTLTYSEAVSRGGSYSNAHFDLDMSTTGSNIAVTYTGGDGTTTHTYTAASAAVNGETVDLDFSGAANSIEETAGYNQDLAAIVSGAVTNSTPGGGGGTEFVTGQTLGTARTNGSNYYLGFKLTVGGSNVTVSELGRYCVTGDTQTHTVYIADSAGAVIISASVDATGGSNAFKFTSITPTVLSASTAYYVFSQEFSGGDTFYEGADTTVTTTAVATISYHAYAATSGGTPTDVAAGVRSYVPVSFKYTAP